MQTVIIMIHLMVVITLIGVVLLQRSEGGGLGSGSQGASFMSSRGSTNLLSRTTAILAAVFFATSLLLSALAGMGRKPASIFQGPAPAGQSQGAPLAPPGGGLLDTLKGAPQGQPPAGSPPASGSQPSIPQSR